MRSQWGRRGHSDGELPLPICVSSMKRDMTLTPNTLQSTQTVVTIDGPAGTGKSTVARALAVKLGFAYLDTGAMYRAVAWAVLERGFSPDDCDAIGRLTHELDLRVDGREVFLNGADISGEIRTPLVSHAASRVAACVQVRQALVEQQRSIGRRGKIVSDGRDQGTVVFPEAICKFFLTADETVRAQRRLEELRLSGKPTTLADVLADQRLRDQRDELRTVAPLRPAADAILVDTTPLTTDQVVDALFAAVAQRLPHGHVP